MLQWEEWHHKPYEACIGSESNVAKLGKDGNKFFSINVSPSKKDLAHLVVAYGEQGAKEKLN
ncbi:hypothetical protein C4F49_02965 [Sphingobacterium sp. KB22]|uniref:Uncharacterized protein n=1 Tax=Sphingobacterium hungaricum TaxID=2082723 RepID=A0A928UTM0_9SPHI|nr:hypothetical protein [Sphingobacterium hungaricum]